MDKEPNYRALRLRSMARHALNCRSCMGNVQALQHSRDPLTRTDAMCAIERCTDRKSHLRAVK